MCDEPSGKYSYRGYDIDIYDDDYGQQYYFYFNNRCISCGAYNLDVESVIRDEIDHYLDDIYFFGSSDEFLYYGAQIRYLDHEHKQIGIFYRGDLLKTIDACSKDKAKAIAKECLDELFSTEEYQKEEKERLARADLYLHEIMKKSGK